MLSKKSALLLFAISLSLLFVPGCARAQAADLLDRSVTIGGVTHHFKIFAPKSAAKNPPMILFLHGAGERGSDNRAQTNVGLGPVLSAQTDFPFVVVMPQCLSGRWWSEPEMQTVALTAFEQTVAEFNGDRTRLYLTGLSMGGYGLWAIAAANPGKFAALAPVCGGIKPPFRVQLPEGTPDFNQMADPYGEVAKKIGNTPTWVFHGAADPVVPVGESQKMVEALKAIGNNVRYTEYEGVGHNSWVRAYAEPGFFKWLLMHKLASANQAKGKS